MAGPILGPVLGGVITDLASWRWIFALNVPLGFVAISGLGQVPATIEPAVRVPASTASGLCCWSSASDRCNWRSSAASARLGHFRQRSWPRPLLPASLWRAIAIRSVRSQFTLFKFQVFRNVNFTTSVFYNFMVGALLFTTIVFLPAMSEGPSATMRRRPGWRCRRAASERWRRCSRSAIVIDRIDHRALLAAGLLISCRCVGHDVAGAGCRAARSGWPRRARSKGWGSDCCSPRSARSPSRPSRAELRTDAAGVYSLLRQLGCATGVAVMTALLQARIQTNSLPVIDHVGGNCAQDRRPSLNDSRLSPLTSAASNHGDHNRRHSPGHSAVSHPAAGRRPADGGRKRRAVKHLACERLARSAERRGR